ncbi:MAG: hypothetical protein ACI9DF_005792, partial [Verrucomicrobiales bacterium]
MFIEDTLIADFAACHLKISPVTPWSVLGRDEREYFGFAN